jgi:hypothetical protein
VGHHIEYPHQVGMFQFGEILILLHRHFGRRRVVRVDQALERDMPVAEVPVPGQIDPAQPARATHPTTSY